MSSLKVEALHREFFYNGTRIPDPAPNLTVEQVRELLSHPEIATATLAGPEDAGGSLRYTFSRALGSKG
jgi:PRTRC genetic system protein C